MKQDFGKKIYKKFFHISAPSKTEKNSIFRIFPTSYGKKSSHHLWSQGKVVIIIGSFLGALGNQLPLQLTNKKFKWYNFHDEHNKCD